MKATYARCLRWLPLTVLTILCLVYPAKQSTAADPVVSAAVFVGLTPSFSDVAAIQFTLLNDLGADNSLVQVTPINETAISQLIGVGTSPSNITTVAWITTSTITSGTLPLFRFDFPVTNGAYPRFTIDRTGTITLVGTPSASSADNFVVSTAYQTLSGVTQYFLNSTHAGTGSGTVTSTPPGISCTGGCSAIFNAATPVTLIPTKSFDSYFAGWSGGGCSGTGNCQVTMNNETTVSATFGIHPPVNLAASYYPLIADAYAAAATGNTIKIRAVALTESPVFSAAKSVTLKGGFDGTFTGTSGYTTLHGTMTVASGTAIVDGIVIN